MLRNPNQEAYAVPRSLITEEIAAAEAEAARDAIGDDEVEKPERR